MKTYFVYILASKRRGTLYVWVTSHLERRIFEHRNNAWDSFTHKYSVFQLVYFEETNDVYSALQREKNLKKWNREWKIELIEKENPLWEDLWNGLSGQAR